MYKDLGNVTIQTNRYHLYNWAIGIDFYEMYDAVSYSTELKAVKQANVFMINLLFFNITITKWARWTSKNS